MHLVHEKAFPFSFASQCFEKIKLVPQILTFPLFTLTCLVWSYAESMKCVYLACLTALWDSNK